jgi:hypothetical protein
MNKHMEQKTAIVPSPTPFLGHCKTWVEFNLTRKSFLTQEASRDLGWNYPLMKMAM